MVVALFTFILSIAGVASIGILKQVHVITRHGSRLPLIKNPGNLSEYTLGSLTALGEMQHFDLGLWLMQRFESQLEVGNLANIHLESSATDRTIVSANSLALGLFDAEFRDPFNASLLWPESPRPNIPIYTLDATNDVFLRAYDKCPTYHDRLENLYSGSEYLFLQQEYAQLLTKLAQIDPFSDYRDESTNSIPVKETWNVFDLVMVAKTECSNGNSCPGVSQFQNLLSDEEWNDLQVVTQKAELLKYSKNIAGRLVGGNLLQRITERMESVIDSENKKGAEFYLYSAHYPTILSVFSALGEDPVQDEVLPPYASALIFELYDRDSNLEVDIVYKPGGSNMTLQLVTSACSGDDVTCKLSDLIAYVSNTIKAEDWCNDCQNAMADICLRQANAVASTGEISCPKDKTTLAVGLLFLGIAIGLAVSFTWIMLKGKIAERPL
jgi:hypothetical protein